LIWIPLKSYERRNWTKRSPTAITWFSRPDGMIGMYVGDVSGKGLPAAMYAAAGGRNTQGHPQNRTASDPGDGSLEQGLFQAEMTCARKYKTAQNFRNCWRDCCSEVPSRYTAIQYALLDPIVAQLHLSRAGRPGPMLLRAGECRVLMVTGIPPGLFPEINYDHLTLQLEPGDSLLFYTDGLIDARNTQQAKFEAEGLQQVSGRHAEKSPLELLGHIFSTIG
jgi:sigma-B regulation protein RsbU (phosphoserine phosphatase)